jgi:hypothetical protein
MPFKSAKQRRWMFANKPAMARRWANESKRKRGGKKKN